MYIERQPVNIFNFLKMIYEHIFKCLHVYYLTHLSVLLHSITQYHCPFKYRTNSKHGSLPLQVKICRFLSLEYSTLATYYDISMLNIERNCSTYIPVASVCVCLYEKLGRFRVKCSIQNQNCACY